ncbi:RagB/SusD family nutrient uptake outer membrane protein [Pedobacter sp. SD-b]|uniref:RagB/SusD family nutrient uptake outer membrane protein n=1 Tax=Pedobacter segetis TaxID=2793069 RepID=A0ABS1BJL2_9SPHI|nr:RagB/SusD family nutrient uptake outer membrane protein [Pedobacter segetis]MBK0383075.1 RagB/SusD family nutrient uptake outer membrane protein [Pedobacter segetis]
MKLNYIKITFATMVVAVAISSCKKQGFLDPVISNDLNETVTFSDSTRTLQFLNSIYDGLGIEAPPKNIDFAGGFPTASLSDEAEGRFAPAGATQNAINTENLSGRFTNVADGVWTKYFQKIRAVNIYLKNVDAGPLSTAKKQRTKAEARVLRAYYYFILMKYFGGVPLLGDDVKDESAPFDILRSPYGDCVDYLSKELTEVAPLLPVTYNGIDYGRVTRGAALSLKGEILLYAASPFFNGGGTTDDDRQIGIIGYPTADASRWQKAYNAFTDVINMPGNPYSLEQYTTKPGDGFYNLFLKRSNTEYVLANMQPANKNMERYLLPPSCGGTGSGQGTSTGFGTAAVSTFERFLDVPSQELVDAFSMKDGKNIFAAGSGYNPNNPYVNRDPRFYYTVIYNGANYMNNTTRAQAPIYTFLGTGQTADAFNTTGTATKTGYFGRKMCDSTVTITLGANTNTCYPLIRYADVLLMYAEAANEVGQTGIAMTQLKTIRNRAGILPGTDGNYGLMVNPSQDQMRKMIMDERFVELAFENKRSFDLKRWKLGEAKLNGPLTGMKIQRIGNTGSNYTFTRVPLTQTRIFTFKSYLWPIPVKELGNNLDFVKNPGW